VGAISWVGLFPTAESWDDDLNRRERCESSCQFIFPAQWIRKRCFGSHPSRAASNPPGAWEFEITAYHLSVDPRLMKGGIGRNGRWGLLGPREAHYLATRIMWRSGVRNRVFSSPRPQVICCSWVPPVAWPGRAVLTARGSASRFFEFRVHVAKLTCAICRSPALTGRFREYHHTVGSGAVFRVLVRPPLGKAPPCL